MITIFKTASMLIEVVSPSWMRLVRSLILLGPKSIKMVPMRAQLKEIMMAGRYLFEYWRILFRVLKKALGFSPLPIFCGPILFGASFFSSFMRVPPLKVATKQFAYMLGNL